MREEPMSLSVDYEGENELIFHKLEDDSLDDPDLNVEHEKLTNLAIKCCESDNSSLLRRIFGETRIEAELFAELLEVSV